MNYQKQLIKAGGILGIAGLILFLFIVVVLEQLYFQKLPIKTVEDFLKIIAGSPWRELTMATHLSLIVVMIFFIVAFLGLYQALKVDKIRVTAILGTILGILACAVMIVQGTVQGAVMIKSAKIFVGAGDESQRQAVVLLYRGLRAIDHGVDLAYDGLFFTAWILLGFAMLKSKLFGKALGTIGIIIFTASVILNIWTAPDPPRFEISPFVSLWILAVFIQMLKSLKTLPLMAETIDSAQMF
jgi:hypothetical protein